MADPASLTPVDVHDFVPVTVFNNGNLLFVRYSTGEILPLTGTPTNALNVARGRSVRTYPDGKVLIEQNGAFYARALPPREAPSEVQPAPGSNAQHPNDIAQPGAPAPAPAAPETATAGPEQVKQEQAAATEEAKRESHSVSEGGNYTDPYAEDKVLVNTYTLTFYEDYKNTDEDTGVSIDLPYVQRVTMQAQNAVARTRSMSGAVYAEHQGFIQRNFTIEGRSGPVWNADAGDAPASGGTQLTITRFTNFRNFLEVYGKTSANNKNALVRYKNTQLILSCTFESESHFCEVVNFNYRRSADTSTYSFEYSITLVTNGPTGRKFNSSSLVGGKAAAQWDKGANQFAGSLTDAQIAAIDKENLRQFELRRGAFVISALNQTTNFNDRLREADVEFVKGTLRGMSCAGLQDLRASVSVVNHATDLSLFASDDLRKARRVVKDSLAWTSFGLDLAHRFKGISGTGCSVPAWSDLYYQIVPYVTAGAAVVGYIKDLFGNNRGYDYTYSVVNTPPIRPGLVPTTDQGPARPFAAVNYFLPTNGADAYSIASFVFGDANLYWRIIDLNNFRDAYTRADGTPLSPGSSVLIPSTTVPASKDTDVFGTDLLIVNGDLQLVGNNDVMRISGYANYTQNLMHRMQTPRGTNRVFPNHGLRADLNSNSSSTIPATIRTDVRNQVLQDHRTDEVRNIALTELGDKVHVSMVVKAIAGTQRTFKFNYDLNSQVTA
jgi:hypothetical protein